MLGPERDADDNPMLAACSRRAAIGKIYFAPCDVQQVLCIDPEAQIVEMLGLELDVEDNTSPSSRCPDVSITVAGSDHGSPLTSGWGGGVGGEESPVVCSALRVLALRCTPGSGLIAGRLG